MHISNILFYLFDSDFTVSKTKMIVILNFYIFYNWRSAWLKQKYQKNMLKCINRIKNNLNTINKWIWKIIFTRLLQLCRLKQIIVLLSWYWVNSFSIITEESFSWKMRARVLYWMKKWHPFNIFCMNNGQFHHLEIIVKE